MWMLLPPRPSLLNEAVGGNLVFSRNRPDTVLCSALAGEVVDECIGVCPPRLADWPIPVDLDIYT